MGFKQKVFSDAGVITPPTFLTKEIQDGRGHGEGQYNQVPKSQYAISESHVFAFTNDVVEGTGHRLNIADFDVRPGTRSYHQH